MTTRRISLPSRCLGYAAVAVLLVWHAAAADGPIQNGAEDDFPPTPAAKADDNLSEAPTSPPPTTSGSSALTGFTLHNDSAICFRASFRSQVSVRYQTAGLDQTSSLTAVVPTPQAPEVSGQCGETETTLTLTYSGGNYCLSIIFTKLADTRPPNDKKTAKVPTWGATSMTLSFNTTSNPDFSNIKKEGVYKAKTNSTDKYFVTPANFSYTCQTQEDVPLYAYSGQNDTQDDSVVQAVTLSVWDTRVQGFYISPSGDFSQVAACRVDIEKNLPRHNIVPLVIAACLSGLIVVIIIAYFFIKNRSQTTYSAME